jgi:uncharacterized repeat protein (TIGR01451 family)
MQLLSPRRWHAAFPTLTGLGLVSFLSFSPTLAAAIRTVDDDGPATYSSITAALAAANPGDTILVAAGTYDDSRETFPLALKDGVAIIGAGRNTTSIVAGDGISAFANDATPLGPTTRLEGFTIAQEEGDTDQVLMQFLLGDATMSPRIESNRFSGNADASDGGIIIIAEEEGGVFDGTIIGNEFRTFGAFFTGPVTSAVSTSFPGALAMGRDLGIAAAAKTAGEQLKSEGVRPNIIPIAEDRVTPTIRGNTFEGNAFAIAVIGSADCSCVNSGIMAPLIDDNEFIENAFDALLIYGGFDFREFSPTVSNNTSTYSLISIGSLPFFVSGPPASSTAGSNAVKGKPAQSAEWREILRGMKSKIERGEMGKDRPAPRAARTVRPAGAALNNLFDVTISGNTITNALFAGILLYQDIQTDETITLNADIRDNAVASTETTIAGIAFGTFVDGLAIQLPGSLLFNGNTVDGPAQSLLIGLGDTISGGPFVTSGVKLAAAAATDVQIVGNRLENGQVGLQFMSDDYTTLAALVSCNVITNQSLVGVGIQASTDPTPDFGGGTRLSPGLNSLHDNALNMDNLDPDEVKAENNYWGTSNPTAVDTSIDGNVDFTPFLTAEPVGCNLIAPTESDLSLIKTVTSTGPYQAGDEISYTLTVTNNGPATATNVEITDPIPFGTEFVSASAGCTASLVTITCTRPTLANGSSRSFNIVVRAVEEGQVANIAVADSDQIDPMAGNSVAVATPVTVGAAAIDPIPTTSEWGLLLMSVMLACAGLWFSRRG